jgi:hypothetical protein
MPGRGENFPVLVCYADSMTPVWLGANLLGIETTAVLSLMLSLIPAPSLPSTAELLPTPEGLRHFLTPVLLSKFSACLFSFFN